MDFSKLEAANNFDLKEIRKLADLNTNEKYTIFKIERKETEIGSSLLVDLGLFCAWLPKRYNDVFTEEAIRDVNGKYREQLYLVVNSVKKIMGNDCALIDIKKY